MSNPRRTLDSRVSRLEELMQKHLEESGEIRTDIAWIKKGVWVVVPATLTTVGAALVALIVFLLNKA